MRFAIASVCVSLFLASLPLALAAAARDRPPGGPAVRWSLEVGPSFDHSDTAPGSPYGYDYFDARNGLNGFALAGGLDGRILGPLGCALMLGYEDYPARGATRVQTDYFGSPTTVQPGTARKSAVTLTEDLRIVLGPWYGVEPFVDLGMGWTWLHGQPRVDLDAGTGEVLDRYPGARFSGLLFEAAAGLRTHRVSGFDWLVGVRSRGYTDILEAVPALLSDGTYQGKNNVNGGQSVQVYVGLLTRPRYDAERTGRRGSAAGR